MSIFTHLVKLSKKAKVSISYILSKLSKKASEYFHTSCQTQQESHGEYFTHLVKLSKKAALSIFTLLVKLRSKHTTNSSRVSTIFSLITILLLFLALKRGLTPNFVCILYCPVKLAFMLTVCVFDLVLELWQSSLFQIFFANAARKSTFD